MSLIYSLIDLTSLNATDTPESITTLCEKAQAVAAVCIFPQFVPLTAQLLKGTSIKVDTVANFPQGTDAKEIVLKQIYDAIKQGAEEIDVVFPYHNFFVSLYLYSLCLNNCKVRRTIWNADIFYSCFDL